MFRRLPSGLPKDPVYPSDLKGLGYFVNDQDEIRSIENPKAYFKYFLTKNERYNNLQREAMNSAIREIVKKRLRELGLDIIRLPLGAKESEPNLPIFMSSNLESKKRVIILFYEHTQDIGILAHRIIGGKGGINEGSVIDMIKAIQSDDDLPGIVLANMGQLLWWRRGKKAVTQTTWFALPQNSAVEPSYKIDDKNTIPGNNSTAEHVNYIFNHVIENLADPEAKLNVIGVSDGAVQATTFLENEENFEKWGSRVSAFASVATYYFATEIKNSKFARWFIDHGRAYITSQEPCGTFLADYDGRKRIQALGCPVFSLGEPYYSETMLPKGYKVIVNWFRDVAKDPNYENPQFVRYDGGDSESEHEEVGWDTEDADEKPMEEGANAIAEQGLEGVKKVEQALEEVKLVGDQKQLEKAKEAANVQTLTGAVFTLGGEMIRGPDAN